MRRLTPLLITLLLLAPLTMAPRTSFPEGELQAEVLRAPAEVVAGQPAVLIVKVEETADGMTAAGERVIVGAGSDSDVGDADLEIVSAPRHCDPSGTLPVTCAMPALYPNQQRVLAIVVRPTESGALTVDVTGDIANQ